MSVQSIVVTAFYPALKDLYVCTLPYLVLVEPKRIRPAGRRHSTEASELGGSKFDRDFPTNKHHHSVLVHKPIDITFFPPRTP